MDKRKKKKSLCDTCHPPLRGRGSAPRTGVVLGSFSNSRYIGENEWNESYLEREQLAVFAFDRACSKMREIVIDKIKKNPVFSEPLIGMLVISVNVNIGTRDTHK